MAKAVLQYPGGKARIARKIVSLFPPPEAYNVFVDAFGGAGNVTLALPDRPDLLKVYNDADEHLVNFFRVLRDPITRNRLVDLLTWTPYSRKQFVDCLEHPAPEDPVERAWRFYVIMQQSFGGTTPVTASPGDWGYVTAPHSAQHRRWHNAIKRLGDASERFQDMQIECLDYADLLKRYDSKRTCFYIDPPYLQRRDMQKQFAHEMRTVEDHRKLAEILQNLSGFVILSGGDCPEYDEWYTEQGWEKHVIQTTNSMYYKPGTKTRPPRIECVWLNPACIKSRKGV